MHMGEFELLLRRDMTTYLLYIVWLRFAVDNLERCQGQSLDEEMLIDKVLVGLLARDGGARAQAAVELRSILQSKV